MLPRIDLPRALLRGRYMAAAAAMEYAGVPIDTATLALLREHWTGYPRRIDRRDRCRLRRLRRPHLQSRSLGTYLPRTIFRGRGSKVAGSTSSDDTFRQMAKAYPPVSPMRELRSPLSDLRLNDLAVGRDGRNRTILSAFRSRTGRNQPSNSKFIFGPSVWLRGLIKPPPGHGVAYIDWSQQEFGIAAALSGDPAMQAAYRSGDPYLAFAKQAGAVPQDATKQHARPDARIVQAMRLGGPIRHGAPTASRCASASRRLSRAICCGRTARPTASSGAGRTPPSTIAMLTGSLHTVFGWHVHVGENSNPRSLRNFPMQANGAEMLRLACCLATERGIEVCAPVHDAVLICAPLDQPRSRYCRHARGHGRSVANRARGFELSTDAHVTRYPDRFRDHGGRGDVMWQQVMALIAKQKAMAAA